MKQSIDIAIIGASFGGLSAYHILKNRCPQVTIKLFDMRTNFTRIPGLFEVIGNPGRMRSLQFDLQHRYGEDFINQKVTTIQPNLLTTAQGDAWRFDYAVIATGSRTNYFGNEAFKKHCYTVRYPEDLPPLNAALPTADTISVIGGGFTGIEISSVLAKRGYDAQIRLIQGRERLVPRLPENVHRICKNYLEDHGVEIILGQRAVDVDEASITLDDGRSLPSEVTILSSGIQINDEQYVDYLTFEQGYTPNEDDNIYLAGDVAIHGLYTTAHNAVMEGRRTGHIIADKIQGRKKDYPPLHNRDKLAIALGEYDGVVVFGETGLFLPYITGIMKRAIEKKVLFEFRTGILLPF